MVALGLLLVTQMALSMISPETVPRLRVLPPPQSGQIGEDRDCNATIRSWHADGLVWTHSDFTNLDMCIRTAD